jgi:hypothetical protein
MLTSELSKCSFCTYECSSVVPTKKAVFPRGSSFGLNFIKLFLDITTERVFKDLSFDQKFGPKLTHKIVSREDIIRYTEPKLGYTRDSAAFVKFVNVLCNFSASERKAFLQFTTGCSSLPPGNDSEAVFL